MSEGVFLDPRNQNTVALLRSGPSAAFGTAGLSVTQKPGCLYQFNALNTSASTAYYLQIHDKATAPIASDVPIWEQKLAIASDIPTSFQLAGLYFANGIAFALSTTPRLLTLAGSADCVVYTRHTTAG